MKEELKEFFVNIGKYFIAVYDKKVKTYCFESHYFQTSVFGWEGDKNSPIIFADGSFFIRDRNNTVMVFGVKNADQIDWTLRDDYMPCYVSLYSKAGLKHRIENFADKVTIDGNDFVVVYSTMTTENLTEKTLKLPKVKTEKIYQSGTYWYKRKILRFWQAKLEAPFDNYPKTIKKGETVTRQYATAVDRFGGSYDYPAKEKIIKAGKPAEHYEHMKAYWEAKLRVLTGLELPDKTLVNAYKAGYIFQMIIKDGDKLITGQNCYRSICNHDVIGILMALTEMNDGNFKNHSKVILANCAYGDAEWKYSLPFALYLMKSNNCDYIASRYKEIKDIIRKTEFDRAPAGYLDHTVGIDSDGFWLMDNWSALTGLTAYKYISDRLFEHSGDAQYKEESAWAKRIYDELFDAVEKTLAETLKKYGIHYLPVSILEPNDNNRCKVPNDANWAAQFMFGRWAWEGYLFGAEQKGIQLELIDATYDYGFERLAKIGADPRTFGAFPGESSGYNAGFGSAALRAEKYRDIGIRAYQYMIENTQSAPLAWWEMGIGYQYKNILTTKAITDAWGSIPNAWSVANCNKVLVNSFIAEKYDGTVIVGRGIPRDWLKGTNHIAVTNYPTGKGPVSYTLDVKDGKIEIEFTGNENTVISLELIGHENVLIEKGTRKFTF